MVLPLVFLTPQLWMAGGGVMSSREHLSRWSSLVAESCYGQRKRKNDPYYSQRVQYHHWKLMKQYERNPAVRFWSCVYDSGLLYVQFWQLMHFLRAVHSILLQLVE